MQTSACTNKLNGQPLWAFLEEALRFSPLWHTLVNLIPVENLESIQKSLLSRQDRALLAAIIRLKKGFSASTCRGELDAFRGNVLYGWACNPCNPDPLDVDVYIDGKLVAEGERAERYRRDLELAGIGNGRHAFEIPLDIREYHGDWTCLVLKESGTGRIISFRFLHLSEFLALPEIESIVKKLAAKGKYKESWSLAEKALLKEPVFGDLLESSRHIAAAAGSLKAHDFIYDMICEQSGKFGIQYIQNPLQEAGLNPDAYRCAIKRLLTKRIEPANLIEASEILRILNIARRILPEAAVGILYENFAVNWFGKPASAKGDLIKDRIGFVITNWRAIPYFDPIRAALAPFRVSYILLNTENFDRSSLDLDEDVEIVQGAEKIRDFDKIIIDNSLLWSTRLKAHIGNKPTVHISHAVYDSMKNNIPNALIIYPASSFAIQQFSSPEEMWQNSSRQTGMEICSTGPFHLGDFDDLDERRESARRELVKAMGWQGDENRPIIFFVESDMTIRRHIRYCLNRLCKSCRIIFKPRMGFDFDWKGQLDPQIHILEDEKLAQNNFRFGADFIMAESTQGTFYSSLMIGLPVLPYYSSLVSAKRKNGELTAFNLFFATFPGKHPWNRYLRQNWKYFFNLIDLYSLQKAILEPYFMRWYKMNIETIQHELFGNYLKKDGAKRTAEYILKFFANGTVGAEAIGFRQL